MRFEFDGKNYALNFERKHQKVRIIRKATVKGGEPKIKEVDSKYPYTTVTLYELKLGQESIKIAEASVGCLPSDKFSFQAGREWALRSLCKNLRKSLEHDAAKALNSAIWNAYLSRFTPPPSDTTQKAA